MNGEWIRDKSGDVKSILKWRRRFSRITSMTVSNVPSSSFSRSKARSVWYDMQNYKRHDYWSHFRLSRPLPVQRSDETTARDEFGGHNIAFTYLNWFECTTDSALHNRMRRLRSHHCRGGMVWLRRGKGYVSFLHQICVWHKFASQGIRVGRQNRVGSLLSLVAGIQMYGALRGRGTLNLLLYPQECSVFNVHKYWKINRHIPSGTVWQSSRLNLNRTVSNYSGEKVPRNFLG